MPNNEMSECPKLTWDEVRKASERAIATARAQGRREGLEEAARIVHGYEGFLDCFRVAAAIRSRLTKEST